MADYDVILVIGESFFDHPLSGPGILKRLLEKYGYSVGIIEKPVNPADVKALGRPKLFFGITSGAIDSMVRNYTPLKKSRALDEHADYDENVKDRAVIVYSNWVRQFFKGVPIILGGTESSLRRFSHYDYWDNNIRKSILFDAKADLLVFGNGEKQILEIAKRIKDNQALSGIAGTCEITKEKPEKAVLLPSHEEVLKDKKSFLEMHNLISNSLFLAQKVDTRFCVQNPFPVYNSSDLDEYYELPFTRQVPKKLRGFEFSVVTHRGCIGNCSFCSLKLIQGDKIVSRTEKSILKEIENITKNSHFKGNIDDLGGPSANMYGMDCSLRNNCRNNCIDCNKLEKNHKRLIALMREARKIKGVNHVFVRSGIRFDLAPKDYIAELVDNGHISGTLRIAPEHVNKKVLQLMNKDKGDLNEFIKFFNSRKSSHKLSFYFMTAHPGSSMKEAKELSEMTKKLKAEDIQIFIPTPMTDSTCMYYTETNPLTGEKVYVPYTYNEKKEQKRILYD
jgi:uncharacterized radical SAM protein YgiQ